MANFAYLSSLLLLLREDLWRQRKDRGICHTRELRQASVHYMPSAHATQRHAGRASTRRRTYRDTSHLHV